MLINVGSKNPVKIEAVKNAFSHYYNEIDLNSVNVDSGVSNQPTSLQEIVKGARNRAQKAFELSKCDFAVGLEAGIFEFPGTKTGYMDISVAVIFDGNNFFVGGSPTFEYPKKVIDGIFKDGKEVGHLFDEITGVKNTKQKAKSAIGILTNNIIPRVKFIEQSVIMALTRVLNKDIYND